ncbi:hypothetical protein BGX21_009595 [Mortierella sp. AD011]|nr:hypothetical protein BGX20_009675 [Mortierella sp. AD010]KAF9396285.1 hypothetical protein BGX21_009595 [Mortierella sp. AD011]
MIISTPKIDDLNDSNTLTMNNTLANAQITADSYWDTPTKLKGESLNPVASSNEDSLQPHPAHRRASTPAHGYVSRVGFDTLSGKDTSEYAFTLQSKTENWKRTKRTRTFLVGIDMNNYSAHALQWVVENMVEDGDEIVALWVVPMELRDSWYKGNHRGRESAARSEATKITNSIRERNVAGKEISITVEIVVGIVRDTFQHMIKVYDPDMLVVGSRGRSNVKGFLSGSVSRFCLNHCHVPVIVVRPERKLTKSKNKAKGIFRPRSSLGDIDQVGYRPHPTQPIHMSTSDFDYRNSLTISRGNNPPSHTELFPSATVHAGDKFPGRSQSSQSFTPLSSLFAPLNSSATPSSTTPAPAPAPLGSISIATPPKPAPQTSSVTFPPQPARTTMPPPPEGMIKMKKSLTTDGTGKDSKGGFGKASSGFLSNSVFAPFLGKSDKDKLKKKRSSQS